MCRAELLPNSTGKPQHFHGSRKNAAYDLPTTCAWVSSAFGTCRMSPGAVGWGEPPSSSSPLAASNSEASRGAPAFLPLGLGPSYLSMHGIYVCHSQIQGLTGQVGFLPWMWAVSFHLFPRALTYFPGGCLGPQPCSALAGHLSHQCFLAPHVREVVLGDVAEILCLHFLFLFLLASPSQACALPARTALCALFWSISGHLYFIKDGKDWGFFNSWF